MIQDIILPLLSIIIGFFYSKWLYKVNNGFFRKNVDLFSNSKDLQGWFAATLLIIVGLLFLLKGISNYL
ncbi:hypothetical protein BIW12_08465 [Flavobacterium commune]|uniref:Uncharacterized protein n=1 Tax=Flavobacterium commune TaxID=1306519 RepID=A0A1D9PBH5_9FLAO|nr:hypothetical protein BIW12_08465 [Flavobacterium commune]